MEEQNQEQHSTATVAYDLLFGQIDHLQKMVDILANTVTETGSNTLISPDEHTRLTKQIADFKNQISATNTDATLGRHIGGSG